MDLRQLGTRIKEQREARNLRQADIAGALQISAQAVSKWERGENAPDIALLVRLSRLLGVSTDWLLGGVLPESETFEATILCSDVSGFAKMAAGLSPREVAAKANTVFFALTEAICRFDGIPVKYMGDAVLAFFAGPNQAIRALKAAVAARSTLEHDPLNIALHRGPVFLGMIGHPDFAAKDIIGETVNTAFLLLPWIAENCDNHLGLSAAVCDELPDHVAATPVGQCEVRGQSAPVMVFAPEIKTVQ